MMSIDLDLTAAPPCHQPGINIWGAGCALPEALKPAASAA